MSVESLTIQREGVLVFLHSANTESAAAERLLRMYSAQKHKDGPVADALWLGHCALSSVARDSIEQLRRRGGLLHFGCARVDRTIDGEYVVRGAL